MARPAPLQAGARSTGRGLRVGVADSFEGGFVWGAGLRIADPAAGPTPRGTMSRGIDAFRYCLGVRWLVTGRNRLCL